LQDRMFGLLATRPTSASWFRNNQVVHALNHTDITIRNVP
jgi:hypothetical protein